MRNTLVQTFEIEATDLQDELNADRLVDFDASDVELEQRLNFERTGTTSISYC